MSSLPYIVEYAPVQRRGCLIGVMLVAWDGGHKKVQVSVDSEVVVRLLVEETQANSPYIHIIRKCKALIARVEWKVTIGHCYCFREANRATDWLSHHIRSKVMVFEAVPN